MTSPTEIKVGQVVKYPEPPDRESAALEGHRNFFNLTDVPHLPRLIMNSGIFGSSPVTTADGIRRPVVLIRSNPLKAGTETTPWHDTFDMDAGLVSYFGDHKVDTAWPLGTRGGNAVLLQTLEDHRSESSDTRAQAAPLVMFRSVERNGNRKSFLEFCGLGVLEHAEVVVQQAPDGTEFENFRFDISIIDLSAEDDQFDWQWINARRDHSISTDDALKLAPAAWRSWVALGNNSLPDLRRLAEPDGRERAGHPSISPGHEESDKFHRSPAWVWDELILACSLVVRNNWHEVKKSDPKALELSELLQRLPLHPLDVRGDDFRNPNSIQRKTADIATAHPDYAGTTTKGGGLTRQVVQAFLDRPAEMLAIADHIMDVLSTSDPDLYQAISTPSLDESAEASAIEGRTIERLHRFKERNSALRQKKINSVTAAGGRLTCEVCSFNFTDRYGQHGDGYIEVHHRVPLHELGESETRLDDLALLCANCHRMCHRRLKETDTWPTIQELRDLQSGRPASVT